ncbi:hypothetical protein MMC31_008036, partial [Peltigera leucophlebia]|nr:hypothetical protein [Peltigera leucophlebia]
GGGSRITIIIRIHILVVAAEETTIFIVSGYCKPGKSKPAGLGRISKYEPTDSLYIKLEQSVIPPGWSNDPLALNLDFCFNGKVPEENLTEEFKTQYNMPNPLPIIVHQQHGLWLIDGGNGKYYLWQNVEDSVGEVYERNLAIILPALGKDPEFGKTKWRRLGHLGFGPPPDFDAPWILGGKVLPEHDAS